MPDRTNRGHSFLELVISLAIVAMFSLLVSPRLNRTLRRAALRVVTVRLCGILVDTRERAIGMERGTAVRFFTADGEWYYARYEDGNGNGVLNAEIAAGVDPQIDPPMRLFTGTGFIPGILPGVPEPDSGTPLTEAVPPVNFNNSSLCSFSRQGSGTPGTLYLTDNSGLIAAIRSSGSSGRVYSLYFDPDTGMWVR